MREDDQVRLGGAFAAHFVRLALQHGVDTDTGFSQQARHLGQHARLIGDAQAQVVAGHHFAHGQHGQGAHGIGQRVGLEGQVRHAVLRVGGVQAGNVHQVGDHGAGGGLRARTLAVVQRGAHGVALHHHGVHRAFHIGNQALGRHQAGVHAQLDALLGALGDAQQLDAVTQLLGVLDVGRTQFGDAFDVGLVELHRNAESDGRHDGGLVRGVHAFDVEGRIGLGIAQALGFLEHYFKVQALVAHLGQDEVGGAVDDAGNPLDAVGRKTFAQRLDDGDAPGHGGFKRHHHPPGRCRRKNLGAVHGQQGLVGGDHVLAGGNRLQHQRLGHAIAANQLDHDVDVRVGDDGTCVVDHLNLRTHHALGALHIQIGHHGNLNAPASAAADFVLVALQYVEHAAADGADAQQAYLDGFHGHNSFALNR